MPPGNLRVVDLDIGIARRAGNNFPRPVVVVVVVRAVLRIGQNG